MNDSQPSVPDVFFPEEVMGIAGVPGVVRLASKGATNAKYTHLVMRFQQVP